MAILSDNSLLRARESSRYKFPSLLSVDKLAIMFLFSGAIGVVLLLNIPDVSFEHFRFGFALCFCMLLSCALPLTLLRHWLNQLRVREATFVVLLLCWGMVTLLHFISLRFTPDALFDFVGLSQRGVAPA